MADVNIKPLGDRVLVEICENTEEMKGGILIPDTASSLWEPAKMTKKAKRSPLMSKSVTSFSPAVTAVLKSKSTAKNTKSSIRMISSPSSAEFLITEL